MTTPSTLRVIHKKQGDLSQIDRFLFLKLIQVATFYKDRKNNV
ncbi:hypothetical protein MMC2321_02463 [Chitinophaga sp. MM2321]